MNKKKIFQFLRFAISIGLISYFVFDLAGRYGGLGGALNKFAGAFSSASLYWLIPAALLHIVGFSLCSLRWKVLLSAREVQTSFGNLFAYYFMAAFFNLTLPSTIGGDAVRAAESKKITGDTAASVMVVIIERLTGLMALVLIAAVGLIITVSRSGGQEMLSWILVGATLFAFSAVIFLAHPRIAPRILNVTKKIMPAKIQSFLENAYAAVAIYYKRPRQLLLAQGISLIFQANMVLYYFLIARALHQDPDPIDFMVKIPVVVFLLMTVPAINGIGVRTAGFKELMKFPAAYALAVEFIDLGLRIFFGLLGGLLFLFYRRPGTTAEVEQPAP